MSTATAIKSSVRSVALALAAAISLSGCQTHVSSAPPSATATGGAPYAWPEKLADFRFRWRAKPGIDLTTGGAVPLRAYLESWLVIYLTGDLNAGYPGFQSATPELAPKGSTDWAKASYAHREIRGFRGDRDFLDPKVTLVGNEDLYVLDVEPVGNGLRAFVCDATFDVYSKSSDDPGYRPLQLHASQSTSTPDFHNMKVWRIEYVDHGVKPLRVLPSSPTTPQRGPSPAPGSDVFGSWFVTGATDVAAWFDTDFPDARPGSPEYDRNARAATATEDAMRATCLNAYPAPADQRARFATTVSTTPPRVDPPSPGWPRAPGG